MLRRTISIVMLLMLVLCVFTESFAATSPINCTKSTSPTKGASFYFNVVTTKEKATVKMTMTRGQLGLMDANVGAYCTIPVSVYGAYEVKVYQLKSGKWVQYDAAHHDIYNKSSDTITLGPKGTYKIQIYHWTVNTIGKSYYNNNVSCIDWKNARNGVKTSCGTQMTSFTIGSAKWIETPSITAKAGSGISSMYKSDASGK